MAEKSDAQQYAKDVKDLISGKQKKRVSCPLCKSEIRQPFGHFASQHTKADLALLICKLLDLEPF